MDGLGKSQQLSGVSNPPASYPQVSPTRSEVSTALVFISIMQHLSGAEGNGRRAIAVLESPFPKAKSHPPKRRKTPLLHTAAVPLVGSASTQTLTRSPCPSRSTPGPQTTAGHGSEALVWAA